MTPSDILNIIQSAPEPLNKRDIAKALHIKGTQPRVVLKEHLRDMVRAGTIAKLKGGLYAMPDGLPPVAMIVITRISDDGDVYAAPQDWNEAAQGEPPTITIKPTSKSIAPTTDDKLLARLQRIDNDTYEAKVIKKVDSVENRIVGLIEAGRKHAILKPANKKQRNDFVIAMEDLNGAEDGDIVIANIQSDKNVSRPTAVVSEVIGHETDVKAISIMSLHEAGLTEEFPDAVERETTGMKVPPLKNREDLRTIPLITIDGADARDFDDAVYAEPMDNGGFHLIVAIADVAHYVRFKTALDTEAKRRGNSTYFPDRVVPMLPEALSNDLCSLRPDEDRASLAVHMWIDERGHLTKYKFVRALIRSHARTTYEQLQTLYDEKADHPRAEQIRNLYDAYAVLDQARQKRGALDLDMPERQIIINDQGDMTGVEVKIRLDSHKLIEEFMILANVAAASALEAKNDPKLFPCVYRIHDQPSLDKLESAREFIQGFDLNMTKGPISAPSQINSILKQAQGLEYSHLISQVILRSQSQAVYSTDNIGHFGLALEKYAHFTSPIRRYADLLVHRALISAYGLGDGGLADEERITVNEIAAHISGTERTSMEAERNAVDRFTAAYLSEHVGAEFKGKINGVTTFGMFVTLDETGADGIIPMRSMKNDYFVHDEKARALIGKRTGIVYRMGARVTVRLKEADGLTGSTVFELAGESLKGAEIPGMVTKPTNKKSFAKGRRDKFKKEKPDAKKKKSFDGKGKNKSRGKKKR